MLEKEKQEYQKLQREKEENFKRYEEEGQRLEREAEEKIDYLKEKNEVQMKQLFEELESN
jgi:hypothetical protein